MNTIVHTDTPETLDILRNRFNKTFQQVFKPRPNLKGSEWAEQHLSISPETGMSAGPFVAQPYQREWIDVMCGDEYQQVVLKTSARVGKTSCMRNTIAYFMANEPSPVMVLLPKESNAKEFSKFQIDPLIRDNEILRGLVKDSRTRDSNNTRLVKSYKGGQLFMTSAETSTGLHGRDVRVMMMDEVDNYTTDVDGYGSPVDLAVIRTQNYGFKRKIILSSTPKIKFHSPIDDAYELSDKRQYYVPCPHCGGFQTLNFAPDKTGAPSGYLFYADDAEHPTYICQHCSVGIQEKYKQLMLMKGEWRKGNPSSTIAGFHINSLYSPWYTWPELVKDWHKGKNNLLAYQTFHNSQLGLSWDESGTTLSVHSLESRLENYNAPLPTKTDTCTGVGVLTAGVDIQSNRIEMAVWGHGHQDEKWLIDTYLIEGNTSTDKPFLELRNLLMTLRYKTINGADIGIRSIAVDCGYETERVHRFVEDFQSRDPMYPAKRTIIAVKGSSTYQYTISNKPKQSPQYNASYYEVGVSSIKEFLYPLWKNTEPGPNFIHLPIAFPGGTDAHPRFLDREILEQLTAERPYYDYKKVKDGKPKREWKNIRTGKRNEQLDMFVYAQAALMHLGGGVLKALEESAKKFAEMPGTPTPVYVPSLDSSMPDVPVIHKQIPKGPQIVHQGKGIMRPNRNIWGR